LEHSVTVQDIQTLDAATIEQRILSLPTVSRMRGA
jgi:hypothetical protein